MAIIKKSSVDVNKEKYFEETNPVQVPEEILSQEKKENKEVLLNQEAHDYKELREKIETMDIDDDAKQHASQTAQDLKSQTEEEKIRKLLLVVEQKGVVYAVNVAKKMDDSHILDIFHDTLATQGFYKKFKE